MLRITLVLLALTMLLAGSAAQDIAPSPSVTDDGPDCDEVLHELAPCVNYLKGIDMKPSEDCCDGAEEVADDIESKGDRQSTCMCIKKALFRIGRYDPRRIPMISKQCGISMVFPPIYPKYDCSK